MLKTIQSFFKSVADILGIFKILLNITVHNFFIAFPDTLKPISDLIKNHGHFLDLLKVL